MHPDSTGDDARDLDLIRMGKGGKAKKKQVVRVAHQASGQLGKLK